MRDQINEIQALENQYGSMLFHMALTHVVDVGVRNLTEENVEAAMEQIRAQDEADRGNGRIPIMAGDFQCEVVRCAAQLAKFSIWALFLYIKKHVPISDDAMGED